MRGWRCGVARAWQVHSTRKRFVFTCTAGPLHPHWRRAGFSRPGGAGSGPGGEGTRRDGGAGSRPGDGGESGPSHHLRQGGRRQQRRRSRRHGRRSRRHRHRGRRGSHRGRRSRPRRGHRCGRSRPRHHGCRSRRHRRSHHRHRRSRRHRSRHHRSRRRHGRRSRHRRSHRRRSLRLRRRQEEAHRGCPGVASRPASGAATGTDSGRQGGRECRRQGKDCQLLPRPPPRLRVAESRTRSGSSGRGRSAKETRMGRPMKSVLSTSLTASCRHGAQQAPAPPGQAGAAGTRQLSVSGSLGHPLTGIGHASDCWGLPLRSARRPRHHRNARSRSRRSQPAQPPAGCAVRHASPGRPGQLCSLCFPHAHTSASRLSKKRTNAKPRDSRVVWSCSQSGQRASGKVVGGAAHVHTAGPAVVRTRGMYTSPILPNRENWDPGAARAWSASAGRARVGGQVP